MWLETRAINSHRANSSLLKNVLLLIEKDDISTVLHVNAATITNNYWARPIVPIRIYILTTTISLISLLKVIMTVLTVTAGKCDA